MNKNISIIGAFIMFVTYSCCHDKDNKDKDVCECNLKKETNPIKKETITTRTTPSVQGSAKLSVGTKKIGQADVRVNVKQGSFEEVEIITTTSSNCLSEKAAAHDLVNIYCEHFRNACKNKLPTDTFLREYEAKLAQLGKDCDNPPVVAPPNPDRQFGSQTPSKPASPKTTLPKPTTPSVGSFSGRVTNIQGDALSDVVIKYAGKVMAHTDKQGNFTFNMNIPASSADVYAEVQGYKTGHLVFTGTESYYQFKLSAE